MDNRQYSRRAAAVTVALALGLAGTGSAQAPQKAAQHFSMAGTRPTFHEDDIDKIEVVVAGANSEGRLSLVESIWTPKFSVSPHFHKLHAETFYIVSGKVEWTIGGEARVMGSGDAVHIPSNTVHSVKVLETMRSLMFYQPGGYEDQVALAAYYTKAQQQDRKVRAHLDLMGDFNRVTGPVAALAPAPAGQPKKGLPIFSYRGKRPGFAEGSVENVEIALSGEDTEGRIAIVESDWLAGFIAPPHFHKQHSETFYVFSGKVEWTVNGETRALGAGDAVHIPANTVHSVKVLEKIHTLWISDPGGLEANAARAAGFTAEEQKDPKIQRLLRMLGDFNIPGAP